MAEQALELDSSLRRRLEAPSLARMGIPRRYWSLTHDHFVERPYYAALHDYILGMRKVIDEGQSLLIYGHTGSGKSALAAYIARIYAEYGHGVAFASASQIHAEIDQRIFDPVDETTMEKFYREVELLVIDGLGVEIGSVRRGSLITQLYEDRFQAQLPTLLTCSVSDPDEISGMGIYPGFFTQKLMRTCTLINCEG